MLEKIFHTKQNMARELGISYGKLTQVWTSDHITKGTQEAMEHLLTYCVKNKVPLDEIIKKLPLIQQGQAVKAHPCFLCFRQPKAPPQIPVCNFLELCLALLLGRRSTEFQD